MYLEHNRIDIPEGMGQFQEIGIVWKNENEVKYVILLDHPWHNLDPETYAETADRVEEDGVDMDKVVAKGDVEDLLSFIYLHYSKLGG